jgi:enoyl-CoA hydratase/carnithine racemase
VSFVWTENHGAIRVLYLSRPKANALNHAMVDQISSAVRAAGADHAVRALVLASDQQRFFSAGFDVAEVFAYDRNALSAHLLAYGNLLARLHTFPKPTVAALTGHAYAGGAILALTTDFRVMAQGAFNFALIEINLGISLPPAVYSMLAAVVGPRHARRMVLTGEEVPPERALEIGLIDEMADPEHTLAQALQIAQLLADKSPQAYAAIKEAARHGISHGLTPESYAPPIDLWFTPEAEERKRSVLAGMGKA